MQGFGKSSAEFAIRYYAKNLQPRGITANSIIPGAVNTEAWNGYLKNLDPKLGLSLSESHPIDVFLNIFIMFLSRCNNKRAAAGVPMQKDWPKARLGTN